MGKQTKNNLDNLSLTDRQLLEECGQEAFHNGKKAKILLKSRQLKHQLNIQ